MDWEQHGIFSIKNVSEHQMNTLQLMESENLLESRRILQSGLKDIKLPLMSLILNTFMYQKINTRDFEVGYQDLLELEAIAKNVVLIDADFH